MLIIPQLFASALDFLENYETLLETTLSNVNGFVAQLNNQFHLQIPNVQADTLKQGLDWLLENVDVDAIMNRILSGNTILVIFEYLGDTFFVLTDIIFGLFISIYLLSGKERIYASIMRTRKALFNNLIAVKIFDECFVTESFGTAVDKVSYSVD